MRSSHTPGPWKVFGGPAHPQRHHLSVIDSIPNKDGKVVANCICHVARTNDDADANARLIAAAPDMLDALREMVQAMNEYGMTVDDPPTKEHRQMMEDALAAIAKAEGEG